MSWPIGSCPSISARPLHLPKARFWRFNVRGALSLILLWDDAGRFGIRGAHSIAPLWGGADSAVEGSLGNWAGFILLGIPPLWALCAVSFLPDSSFYIRRPGRTVPLHLQAPESCRSPKFLLSLYEPKMPPELWDSWDKGSRDQRFFYLSTGQEKELSYSG